MNRLLLTGSLVGAAMLTACATTTADAGPSERASERLAGFDRTGEKTSCINLRRISSITPLDDRNFLVRAGTNDYYLNRVSGRCSGAARGFNHLQYKTSQANLCRNEIIRVVDSTQGFTVGSCGLGDFERLEKKAEPVDEASD